MEAGGSGGGGGTLSEIYHSTQRLLLRATGGLERLERLDSSSSSSSYSFSYASSSSSLVPSVEDPGEIATEIKRDIYQIRSLCAEMDHLWRSVPSRGQRDLWKRKVEVVAEKVDSLKEGLDKQLFRQQNRMLEARERAQLLEGANRDSEHVLRIFDEEAQAMQSARNSSMMLEEAYTTGVAVLFKYAEQRDRLKRAQRKALDILNTVGLSNTVLKLIERRHRIDKWIAYSGMGISFMVVLVFMWWVH
ncbi:membrin-11-like [Curcuma longa]|uniref:membrin-11-like n=1 Tax=Curcuma longa TaxID=136217 RepID=UPI003D9FA587